MNHYIIGTVFFTYAKKDILAAGAILSKIIFNEENKFYGLEYYYRDECPYIYTDNFLGCSLSITQHPIQLDLFSLEIEDYEGNPDAIAVNMSDRLKYYVEQCKEFSITNEITSNPIHS